MFFVFFKRINDSRSLGFDEIESLYRLSQKYKFPSTLTLLPEFEGIGVDQNLLDEFFKIVECSDTKVLVNYHTTSLCKIYLSIISFVHPFLISINGSNPVIPLFFYFHSKKLTLSNDTLWKFFSQKIGPKIIEKIFFVTECDDAIRSAIRRSMPNVTLLRCWKHLFEATKRWLKEHKGEKDQEFYCSSLRELLLQKSETAFNLLLSKDNSSFYYVFGY